jgi:5-(carboxyamino)imidazole ribonucleotide mutase
MRSLSSTSRSRLEWFRRIARRPACSNTRAALPDVGIEVLIAGAGGAAHLTGMVASATPLPVIGVPVPLARLDGWDSLLSIVQMPAGVPVATVSIGGARNAGLLVVRILGTSDQRLRDRMVEFQAGLEAVMLQKDAELRRRLLGNG